jgi:hypothetical protein
MDDVISLITRWSLEKIYITVGEFRYIGEILNEPLVYDLILRSIQESHNPWSIIDKIKINETLMNDEKIKKAMRCRTEFIAKAIACVNHPKFIYSMIKGIRVITNHSAIEKVVAEMNLES